MRRFPSTTPIHAVASAPIIICPSAPTLKMPAFKRQRHAKTCQPQWRRLHQHLRKVIKASKRPGQKRLIRCDRICPAYRIKTAPTSSAAAIAATGFSNCVKIFLLSFCFIFIFLFSIIYPGNHQANFLTSYSSRFITPMILP